MAIESAASLAATGTFPGRGGLYDQPTVLIQAMAVIGEVEREARQRDGD